MDYFCDPDKREAREVFPGMYIRTFWGDNMLLSIVDIAPHSEVPTHSHPHEQAGTVLTGELEMTIDGESRLLTAGDTYIISGGVEHSAKSGAVSCRVLDVFSPVRDEYKY